MQDCLHWRDWIRRTNSGRISLMGMLSWLANTIDTRLTEEVYTVMDTAMDCDMVSYANGQPFMTQYCLGCHRAQSSNRQGAPLEVTLDSMDNIVMHLDSIRHEVRSETMPPSGGVAEDSIELVVEWLNCEGVQ